MHTLIRPRFARPPSPALREKGGTARSPYENACAGGCNRRGRDRGLDALPSRQEGLDGQCARRAQGAHPGSTWHAAGLLPLFNLSYSVGQIHKYSVAFYKTLEKETGLDVGLRQVSNIRLARTRDRMDEYHYYAGVAATIGVEVKFLKPQEVKEIWPLCNVEGILGAIQHPED